MTDLDVRTDGLSSKPVSRRTVIKTAAWSVPVIAATAALPHAAASVNNAGLAFTASQTALLTLNLLDGGGTLTATALVTVPTQLTVDNGPGALSAVTTVVTVAVGRPTGINLPVGRARGFGVYSFDGVLSTSGERTTTYQTTGLGTQFGFPATTFSRTITLTIASDGTLNIPIVFGLAGTSTGVAISALATFPVTATFVIGGKSYVATSSISVPVGAGIL